MEFFISFKECDFRDEALGHWDSNSGWLHTFASLLNLFVPEFSHLQSGIIFISTLRIIVTLKECADEG